MSMKKVFRFLILNLLLVFVLSGMGAFAQTEGLWVRASRSAIAIDAYLTDTETYVIEGTSYLKLRDIAYLLSQTDLAFGIQWDGKTGVTQLVLGGDYVHDWGDATPPNVKAKLASPNQMVLKVGGKTQTLATYKIDGSNYLRLRDSAGLIGAEIKWEPSTSVIHITDPKNPKAPEHIDLGENSARSLTATDYTLYIGSIPQKGLYQIGERYYYAFGNEVRDYQLSSVFYPSHSGTYEGLSFSPQRLKSLEVVLAAPESQTENAVVGAVTPLKRYLKLDDNGGKRVLFKNALFNLGDHLMLVDLAALNAITQVRYDHGKKAIYLFEEVKPEQAPNQEKDLVNDLLKSLNLSGKTPKQKVEIIHDHIVRSLEYDTNYYTYGTADAIRTGRARASAYESYRYTNNVTIASKTGVCEDYANLLHELCTRAGIPSKLQYGVAGGDGHLWNYIYFDGKWRIVDATWNDPVPDVKNPKTISRTYFDIAPERLYRSHYWSGSDYQMPDYDPSWQQLIGTTAQSPEDFRKILIANMRNKSTNFVVKVKNNSAYGGIGALQYYYNLGDVHYYSLRGSYDEKAGGYRFSVMY